MTPDTFEKIMMIRTNDGVMEYTCDGQNWLPIFGSDFADPRQTVSSLQALFHNPPSLA